MTSLEAPIEALKASIEELKMRGPDNQSFEIFSHVGLGHTRLSIIDLEESANQPMHDISKRFSIVFNGEIFNYKELEKELSIKPQTNSDTEILLYSYIKWKKDCIKKLRGFFAFAIFDHEEKSLFLARDSFGIKPLYYAITEDHIYFSSELKALNNFSFNKDINHEAFNSYFQLSYIPAPFSIFKGSQKLKPGHFLEINSTGVVEGSVLNFPRLSKISYEEAKSELKKSLREAISLWVKSDAPLGAFLSGGIDSSIVVALASERIKNLKTFSISFPDFPFHDESKIASEVAKKFNTDHTTIPIHSKNLLGYVDDVLNYLDEPFADTSTIPTYALCREVSRHVKVALSGDGADEVFGGYEKHRAEYIAQKYSWISHISKYALPFSDKLPASRDSLYLNLLRKTHRFFSGISLSKEERYWEWCRFIYDKDLKKILEGNNNKNVWKDKFFPHWIINFDGINQNLIKDTLLVLQGDMLNKVDLMSMANSLEVRPVLLDQHVVNFSFTLPSEFKVNSKERKKILLETFKDVLPTSVYDRPKRGFSIQLMPFFRDQFWEKINEVYLNEKLIKEQGIFNPNGIEDLKRKIKTQDKSDIQALVWSLITFQNFWLKYKIGM